MKALNFTEFKAAFVAANEASSAYITSSPLWVQVWIGVLTVVLLPSLILMFNYREARWVAWSLVLIAVWTPIMIMAAGTSRLWGITHLSFWTPVFVVVVAAVLKNGTDGKYNKWVAAVALVMGISLMFDLYDVIRFVDGGV